MEREKLSELLHILPTGAARRGSDCPDDNVFAAYLDRELPAAEHQQIAMHVADCDFCLSQAGLMTRLQKSATEFAPGEFAMARAKRLGKHFKRAAISDAGRWASAAVILLAVFLIFRLDPSGIEQQDNAASSPAGLISGTIDGRDTRNHSPAKLELQVLAPVDGAALDPGTLTFAWNGIPGSLYYDVRIVTDSGDIVWQSKVETTRLNLPDSLQLEPDTDYFFRVDAHLASAKDISSPHVLFSIREQR